MAVCSFQSASSWTRPCCMSTRVKCFKGSKVSREKSPFMMASLSRKDDARVNSGGRELVEARAQVCLALRLEEVVIDAHLRLVVGPARNLSRARLGELAIGGRAVAHAVEVRPDAHLFARAQGFAPGPALGISPRIEPGITRRLHLPVEFLQGRRDGEVWLAVVASRRAGAGREVAEAHAARLCARDADAAREDCVLGERDGVRAHFAEDVRAHGAKGRVR